MKRFRPQLGGATRKALAVAAVLALAVLPGCSSGGSGESGSAEGNITLKFITADTGGMLDTYKEGIKKYEKLHPNIKVELTQTDFPSYNANRKLIFSSDDAPDVGQASQGYGINVLVQNQLIVNMDSYAEKFGWTDKIPAGLLDEFRVPEDGRGFGSGPLWGVGSSGHILGIFYNKERAGALGVDPQSFESMDDLDAALAKAKAAGVPGIMAGATDNNGDGIAKLVEPLLSAYMDPQARLDWIHGKASSTIETPEALAAVNKLVEWRDKGYIYQDAAGISNTDALGKFANGEGLFYIAEDQFGQQVFEGLGDKGGFAAFPPAVPGKPRLTGSSTQPLVVSAKSKHPEEAADFVNFFVTTQMSQTFIDNSLSPIVHDDTLKVPDSGVAKEVWSTWQDVSTNGVLTLHLDWATTTIQGVFNPGAVGLLVGSETPESYLKKLQDDWNASWS